MNHKSQIKNRIKYLMFFLIVGILSYLINHNEKGSIGNSYSSIDNIKIIIDITNFTYYIGIGGSVLCLILLILALKSAFFHNGKPIRS